MEREFALERELPVEDRDCTRRTRGTRRREIYDWRERGRLSGAKPAFAAAGAGAGFAGEEAA